MSLRVGLNQAVTQAVRAAPELAQLSDVFSSEPERARRPYATLDEAVLNEWGTKDRPGREARVTLILRDEGEAPTRLRALADAAEAALLATPEIPGGEWQLVSMAVLRSRVLSDGNGRWAAMIDFRARLLAVPQP